MVPPFTPPPASHMLNPYGLWSRPILDLPESFNSTDGVRPNSPPKITSVSSNMPRCFKSLSNAPMGRSEEHTSELQSRLHLVCRLLLEKKKKELQLYLTCPQ